MNLKGPAVIRDVIVNTDQPSNPVTESEDVTELKEKIVIETQKLSKLEQHRARMNRKKTILDDLSKTIATTPNTEANAVCGGNCVYINTY